MRLQLELLKRRWRWPSAASSRRSRCSAAPASPTRRIGGRGAGRGELGRFYDEAREFARLCTLRSLATGDREQVICTGGGPGIMEAGNRGAAEAGGVSVSLNIVLPHEQAPNLWGTPELSFNFHYFAIRKMHFLMRAKALAVFPGGFGTLDELFEVLTLVQTGRMARLPIRSSARASGEDVVHWDALVEAGTIAATDLDLLQVVETAAEGVAAIDAWPKA